MKKLFVAFLSVMLIFGSCAKIDDITGRMSSQDEEVVFSVSNGVSTKAIVDTTAMIDHFGVYGYVVPGDYSNGGYLMKNAHYDEKGDAVSGSYYWPKSDNPNGIDFIFTAYSQFDGNVNWTNDTLRLAIPTLTQALIDNPDDFDDVLWAQSQYNHHQNGNVGAEHERVALNFRHALSWLQFRGEVTKDYIKWVKVKQISFGEYRDSIPGVPAVAPVPAYNDTTDTWVNLKNGQSAVASNTDRTSANSIPAALIAEIKSYYSIDNGTPGDYTIGLGKSMWDPINKNTNLIKQLRVVKDIPAAYKKTYELHTSGVTMDFFDGFKYLSDNGYTINPATTGGKPAVWDNVVIGLYVNDNGAYTVVTFDPGNSYSVPQYTIVEHPEVPGVPGVDPVPACGSVGLYVDGILCLPTKDTFTTTPLAVYGAQKDTTLNYVKAQVDTIFTNDHIILGNSLVVPQPVPEKITVVFDICISNPGGEDVVFTDRKITSTINTGKDNKGTDYTASWAAANKYIYNFKFEGSKIDFAINVLGWTTAVTNEYYVWDYTD